MWKPEHDKLLTTWRQQAATNLWLQVGSGYYYRKLDDFLAYPSIILSTITSISVFATLQNNSYGPYLTSVMALASGILVGINKHAKAAEKAECFTICSKEYYALIREIDFILSTPMFERGSDKETIANIRSTFDKVVEMSLDPPLHIIRQYELKFKPIETQLLNELESEMKDPV
jgi:hypothetical protein